MSRVHPNLKIDIDNNLRNQKYYEELELLRLATSDILKYEDRISLIIECLNKISNIDKTLVLSDKYFVIDNINTVEDKK